ncbi:hypothetical protein DFH05DRAFT_197069 [Lentinula detonsa]|uniref:Uncharacterized protein n=1 Tax=Lentinula detonsa TaxID=2804962 RepID=A0A9W8PCU8_9AGAR|nr:hypothetical protein DFH05DRAFT_197069 [Lentinula detonsa]
MEIFPDLRILPTLVILCSVPVSECRSPHPNWFSSRADCRDSERVPDISTHIPSIDLLWKGYRISSLLGTPVPHGTDIIFVCSPSYCSYHDLGLKFSNNIARITTEFRVAYRTFRYFVQFNCVVYQVG